MKTKSASVGRLLRIALGVFLLALFGYALLPGVLYGHYPAGRVNAELVTLRAPIDGQIAFGAIRPGDRVQAGQVLAVLRDPPDRDVRLANLTAQAGSLEERIASLDTQIAALTPLLTRLDSDSRNFRTAVVANLTAQIAETEARVTQAEANARLLDAQFRRIQPLAAAAYASTAELDRRRAEADVARAELVAQRKALDRLRQERAAADGGVYLSDSYNNAPYSQQRRDDIELQRLTLVNRRGELDAERTQLQRQIEAEQRRRLQTGEANVVAPADGILWRLLESENTTIGTSAPLLQIADCSRIFFEVSRDRRTDDTLAIGDSVTVEFERNGRMVEHKARLSGIRGDQDTDRREFAVTGGSTPEQLRWIFSVDFTSGTLAANGAAQTLQVDQPEACPIGRIGHLRTSSTAVDRVLRYLPFLKTAG